MEILEAASFYKFRKGQQVIAKEDVHGVKANTSGRVIACRSSAGLKKGGTPEYLVKFNGHGSNVSVDESQLK